MAAVTICSDFGASRNKVCHCCHCLPIYLSWSDGARCRDLSFLNVEFWANFFMLLFDFYQESLHLFFAFYHKCILSAYLRLLIFLPAILIPAFASSSRTFCMMCSAYKLNKLNIQSWRNPCLIWNQSVVLCSVLTVVSWPAYRFLRRKVRRCGSPISFKIFYSVLWSTQSKTLAQSIKQVFFLNSFVFLMIQRMLAIWSLVPLPFLNPAWTSGSSQLTYCWSLAWRILSITLLACEMSATVRWFKHSLALPFFGTGMKTDLFQSSGNCWVFQIC